MTRQRKPADRKTAQRSVYDIELPQLQRTLRLAGLLQTSLDIENILQYFIESLDEVTQFSGVEYVYEPMDIRFRHGRTGCHASSYRLTIAGDDLGEISFTRNKRFSAQEQDTLENSIYQLLYPLRNSLQYQRVVRAAQMDALTGVYNRAAMDRSLAREVELSHRLDNQLSLLIIDVDHFKDINDHYGHTAGDTVLNALVSCINVTMRGSDIMFRYGGDEFALILAGTGQAGARQVGERIRSAVASHGFDYNGHRLELSVSIGIATLERQDSANCLFNKADDALYQAKRAGRNRVCSESETGQ